MDPLGLEKSYIYEEAVKTIIMKQCNKCKQIKNLHEFGENKSKKDKKQSACKVCRKLESKNWYESHKTLQKLRVRARNKKIWDINRRYAREFLLKNPCVDCGEKNPIVLEFDHKFPKQKIDTVSYLIYKAEHQKLKDEIDKCEIRCSNCHKIKTAKQLGWYKWL